MRVWAIIDADSWCYSIPAICQTDGELNSQSKYLTNMLDNKVKEYLTDLKTDKYTLHLTSGLGFRGDIASWYKQSRPSKKPLLYKKSRDYLIERYKALVHSRIEADDAVGIQYYELLREGKYTPVMCHIDKDLNQYEGLHYRPSSGKKKPIKYTVKKEQGLEFMYRQAIMGDLVDNIKGVKGYGPVKAKKYLEGSSCEEEHYLRCLGLYKDKKRLDINMKLLYMLRTEDDFWSCPV